MRFLINMPAPWKRLVSAGTGNTRPIHLHMSISLLFLKGQWHEIIYKNACSLETPRLCRNRKPNLPVQ
jgi:hypothetical protein